MQQDRKLCSRMKKKIKNLERNENASKTYKTLRHVERTMLSRTFRAISVYIQKLERHKMNELTIHPKDLEKQQCKFNLVEEKE